MIDLEKKFLANSSAKISGTHYQTIIKGSKHSLIADEPVEKGGQDIGPDPYELLLASLGSCTAITLRMYVERKMWIVDEIKVDVEMFKVTGGTMISRMITTKGQLSDEQKKRLTQIADACPIHKILAGNVSIETHVL